MILGRIVRVWRESEKISMQVLADRMEISKSTLSRFETGKTIDGTNLLKVLSFLVCDKEKK